MSFSEGVLHLLKCQVSRAARLLQPCKCINRAQPLVRHVHKCHVRVDSRMLLNVLPEAMRAPSTSPRVDLPPLRVFRLPWQAPSLRTPSCSIMASSHKSDSSSSSHPLLLFVLRVCDGAWR